MVEIVSCIVKCKKCEKSVTQSNIPKSFGKCDACYKKERDAEHLEWLKMSGQPIIGPVVICNRCHRVLSALEGTDAEKYICIDCQAGSDFRQLNKMYSPIICNKLVHLKYDGKQEGEKIEFNYMTAANKLIQEMSSADDEDQK